MPRDPQGAGTDAVAQARFALDRYHEAMTYDVDEYLELRDALIAAVRAECAAKVPPTPDLDAVVARVRSWLDRNGWEGDERVPVDPEMPVGNAILHGDLRALLAAVSRKPTP